MSNIVIIVFLEIFRTGFCGPSAVIPVNAGVMAKGYAGNEASEVIQLKLSVTG